MTLDTEAHVLSGFHPSARKALYITQAVAENSTRKIPDKEYSLMCLEQQV